MICEHRPYCDGCPLFETTYEQWSDRVRGHTKDILASYPVEFPEATFVPAPKRESYRSRARLVIRRGKFGFFKAGTRDLLPIERCVVQTPEIESALVELRRFMKAHNLGMSFADFRSGKNGVVLTLCVPELTDEMRETIVGFDWKVQNVHANVGGKPSVPMSGEQVTLVGDDQLVWEVGERAFSAAPTSFQQVNLDVVRQMHSVLKPHLAGEKRIADLYCGIGTHSLSLVDDDAVVFGFDRVQSAITSAELNAQKFGRTQDVWACQSDTEFEIPEVGTAITNPGRAGMSPILTQKLVDSEIKTILYVSCQPETFYRDLERLSAAYDIASIDAFEMMPRTERVEFVGVLKRKTPQAEAQSSSSEQATWVARVLGACPNGSPPRLGSATAKVKKLRKVEDGVVVRITSKGLNREQLLEALRRWGYPVLGDDAHGNRSVNRKYRRERYLDLPVLIDVTNDPIPGFLLPFFELPRRLLQETE